VEQDIQTMYEPMQGRKSIHDLPSYVSSGPTVEDILKLSLPEIVAKPKIRYSVSVVSIAGQRFIPFPRLRDTAAFMEFKAERSRDRFTPRNRRLRKESEEKAMIQRLQ